MSTGAPSPEARAWPEWRAFVLAGIAAWCVLDPYRGLRYGGVVAALLVIGTGFRPRRTDLLLLALFLFSALSYFWSEAPDLTWATLVNQGALAGLVIGVRAVGHNAKSLQTISLGLLAGCAYSLFLLWGLRDTVSSPFDPRVGIEGVNQNYTAYSLATGAALLVLLWRGGLVRLGAAVPAFALLAWGISLNGTRGAAMGLIGLALWGLLHWIAPVIALRTLVVVAAGATLAVAAGWLDVLIAPTPQAGRETGDLNGRLVLWPYARELIAERPVAGWGAGGFADLNQFHLVAHNAALEVGVGLGLVGVGLVAAILYSALIRDTRAIADPRERALVAGSVLLVTVTIFLSGNWDQGGPGWIAVAVVSCAASILNRRDHADEQLEKAPDPPALGRWVTSWRDGLSSNGLPAPEYPGSAAREPSAVLRALRLLWRGWVATVDYLEGSRSRSDR